MRLIDTDTLELHEFWEKIPQYAILSHTWEKKGGEVTFQEWKHRSISQRIRMKKGYLKIRMACRKAKKHGQKYLWCDTNCIDKTNSVELSEAINSMFTWYQNASICYVYLSDVGPVHDKWKKEFCESTWFTRGWTLQELLAPKKMTFYSRDWSRKASRVKMAGCISQITRISEKYLDGNGKYNDASVAQKMSWLSRRRTTRIEDTAYCMLGIFGINMPLLYGEGSKAFTRLQEEIIRTSNDQSIFCWTWTDSVPPEWFSLLAPCPEVFEFSNKFISDNKVNKDIKLTYKMTNAGLSINLPIVQSWRYYLGILNVQYAECNPAGKYDHLVAVPLHGSLIESREMRRGKFPPGPVSIPFGWNLCQSHLYISSNPKSNPQQDAELVSWPTLFGRNRHPFLLVFGNTENLLDEDIHGRDWNRSELSPGNRVCLLETKRPLLEVFPRDIFDERRGLIALDRTSIPQGFLIRIGMNYPRCFVFIGIGTPSQESAPRPQELYRVCNVVPELELNDVSTFEDLLERQIDSMKLNGETCEESSRYGIRITLREESVTETDSICLIYIVCEEDYAKVNSGDGSDTRPDVDMKNGRHHERTKSFCG